VLGVFKIFDSVLNGLQIGNKGGIKKIASAVDFSLQSAEACREAGADLLLVHHGFLWGKSLPVTGRLLPLLKYMLEHNLALMAHHLPLDIHESFGNNALLVKALRLKPDGVLRTSRGVPLLTLATPGKNKNLSWKVFLTGLKKELGEPLSVLAESEAPVRRIGIISGRGGSYLEEAIAAGCDTFLTGDADHTLFHLARETGIRVISAGHYATETYGVRAFGRHLSEKFQIPFVFLDLPTQL
jgi:dinuclear metal center YbgI/SA1388 family protein